MFEAAEMQLIRANPNALQKFEELLDKLSIPRPDWRGNEFRIYEKLDEEITKKICGLMKSDTTIDGYTNLLKLGGVPYDYSESYNQLLGMVVANRNKILRGLENLPKFVEVEVDAPPEPQPITPPRPKMKTITHEEHVTLKGPIIFGVLLIGVGLAFAFNFDDGIVMDEETIFVVIGAALIILGIIPAGLGVIGKTKSETVTVPVTEKVPTPQPVAQSVRQKQIVRKEVRPPFTRNELQKTLDVLAQVDKIVRAI